MSVLCVVFEFFFLAVLRIGIRGAALGTCLSMMVCAFLAMLPFFRGKMVLKFVRPKFSRRILGQIVSCGCPTFLNNIAGRVTSIIMNMVLLQLGGASAVSVYGILMYADGHHFAADVRHVRFAAAGGRLQLGRGPARPGCRD